MFYLNVLTFLNSCDKRFNKFCMHEIQHHAPSSDLCKPTSIKLIIIVINASHGENVQFPTEHSAIFAHKNTCTAV